ncbi:hypothetical protein PHJA_002569600 [Phtheirospermum japonicum]|uniref:Uncharacterized protein n=1 Tax=Phtheirospermum japonicum TaxID=374723 RepID=A0A830CYD6_9LAMI|nr:hypothetical protein PHJA_002569600 [Phtheirospermum japonicum]
MGWKRRCLFPLPFAGFEEVLDVGKDQLQTSAIDKQTDISSLHQVFVKMPDKKFSEKKGAMNHESVPNQQKNTNLVVDEMSNRNLPEKHEAAK